MSHAAIVVGLVLDDGTHFDIQYYLFNNESK